MSYTTHKWTHLAKDHQALYALILLTNCQVELLPRQCGRQAVKQHMVLEFEEWPGLILWIVEMVTVAALFSKTWKEFELTGEIELLRECILTQPTLYDTGNSLNSSLVL
jgi:hypothetical protein